MKGQLCGMPLAGPESFSQQQLAYLKRALGVDETVLYQGTTNISEGTLSEAATNFSMLRVCFAEKANSAEYLGGSLVGYVDMAEYENGNNIKAWCSALTYHINSGNALGMRIGIFSLSSPTEFISTHIEKYTNTTTSHVTIGNLYVTKVVGVHRIAGGNT